MLQIFAIIDDTSVMNFRKNLQYNFPKNEGGGGSIAVWNFYENSSVLEGVGAPNVLKLAPDGLAICYNFPKCHIFKFSDYWVTLSLVSLSHIHTLSERGSVQSLLETSKRESVCELHERYCVAVCCAGET